MPNPRSKQPWNACDECGKFISYSDIAEGIATHVMVTPDSEKTRETFETLCSEHSNTERKAS